MKNAVQISVQIMSEHTAKFYANIMFVYFFTVEI